MASILSAVLDCFRTTRRGRGSNASLRFGFQQRKAVTAMRGERSSRFVDRLKNIQRILRSLTSTTRNRPKSPIRRIEAEQDSINSVNAVLLFAFESAATACRQHPSGYG